MAVKKYAVQWALHHDGKEYKAGDTVSIDEKVAEPLLVAGVITLPQAKATVSETE